MVVDLCDDPLLHEEIRTIVTAAHTRDQLDRAIEILVRVGRRMNILE